MKITIIGTFPPPTHGMSTINQALFERLVFEDWVVEKANTSPQRQQNSFVSKLSRVRAFFPIWKNLLKPGVSNGLVCLALSGGWGQIYDILTAFLCRLADLKCFFYHHSVAYLVRKQIITTLLFQIAGEGAAHIVLCDGMKTYLEQAYGRKQVVVLSNFAFLQTENPRRNRTRIRTIGYISNLTKEKGGWDILKLADAIRELGLPVKCKIAGPCQDHNLRTALLKAHEQGVLEWIGPVYDKQKTAFWSSIDVFVFPTQYENEAEPLVIWEALSSGVPVISYNRGCISTQVGQAGELLSQDLDFVDAAIKILNIWLDRPDIYHRYVRETQERSKNAKRIAETQWELFTNALDSGTVSR